MMAVERVGSIEFKIDDRVKKAGGAEKRGVTAQRPSCAPPGCAPDSEYYLQSELNGTRLRYVVVNDIREAESVQVPEVLLREEVAHAIEHVEDLGPELYGDRFRDASLLQYAEVLILEGQYSLAVEHGRGIPEEPERVRVIGPVSRAGHVGRGRRLEVRRGREGRRIYGQEPQPARRGVEQDRRAREVEPQVSSEAHGIEEVPVFGREDRDGQPRLIPMYAADLPAAGYPVDPSALIQEPPPPAERKLEDVVEDEHVRRVVLRYGAKRLAVLGVLQHSAERRAAEQVFGGVGDQLRERVREAELQPPREPAVELDLQGVVPALALALEQVVDAPVLREGAQRLGDCSVESREDRVRIRGQGHAHARRVAALLRRDIGEPLGQKREAEPERVDGQRVQASEVRFQASALRADVADRGG